jgi:replicative DNA helicase
MNQVATLRQPPQSIDAELALIGGCLIRPEAFAEITLDAGAFYRREHRALWVAMKAVSDAGKPLDAVSVSDELARSGELQEAGGIEYLSDLINSTYASSNLSHYAAIVRGRAIERALAAKGHQLADIAYSEGSTEEKLAKAQALMADLEQAATTEEPKHVISALQKSVNGLDFRYKNKGRLFGLATGFADLDGHMLGMVDGDLIVVAGRPSMGKTTFAMNVAENVALDGGFVIVFSLEMSEQKLADRMICSIGRIDAKAYRQGEVVQEDIDRAFAAVSQLKQTQIYIDDWSGMTSTMLLARARRIARKMGKKPSLIVVDYLQIMRDKGDGVARITQISANLKQAAREMNCPVIALSQLNRSLEQRQDKRPIMSDLRESGAIEQDADVIVMLYRDEVYNEQTTFKGVAEAIIRKNRDGELGTVNLAAPLHRNRFETLSSGWRPPQQEQTTKSRKGGFEYGRSAD